MAEKILFVDDEPNVLQAIQRGLRKRYTLDTALSGKEALELFDSDGPYAVIVSDMRMPEMNGAELLSLSKERSPDTVRIMLTGNADQQTAIDAINKGDILRFLSKPSSADEIAEALEAALAHHRLIIAEKELLRDTLRGSVQALTEILALTDPETYGRSIRIKNRMRQVAEQMGLDDLWMLESVALLSPIGLFTVPQDIVKRKLSGGRLSLDEQDTYSAHANVGYELLSSIPRLEDVAAAVRLQEKYYDGTGAPDEKITGQEIPIAARIMRALLDVDFYETGGDPVENALLKLNKDSGRYDPDVLAALARVVEGDKDAQIISIPLRNLTDDMQLASDILTSDGTLLLARGQSATQSVRRHLDNYYNKGMIDASIDVWCQLPKAA